MTGPWSPTSRWQPSEDVNGNSSDSGGQYNNAKPGPSCTGHRCVPDGINERKVTDALENVRDALDGGFFGVRSGGQRREFELAADQRGATSRPLS